MMNLIKKIKNENEYAIQWLKTKIEILQHQLKEVEKLEFNELSNLELEEIELLLTPEGRLAEGRIKNIKEKIFQESINEVGAPNLFRKKVREELFLVIGNYFVSEIKDNSRVRSIFNAHLLAKLDINLNGLQITVERILESLDKITTRDMELGRPLLTIEEYLKMPDIKPLLKYEKFIDRHKEINVIKKFMDGEEKIMVIIGDGGVGKTRLIIEFAKQMKEDSDWNIYFINPELSIDRLPSNEKILLILDESTRYNDRSKLIVSVIGSISGDIKLILIDRPIFQISIVNFLSEKNISTKFYEIGKGNISGFLKEHCNWIDDNVAKNISDKCRNSFDFAIVYAEYYKEKSLIGDLEKILSWKVAKYIKDIKDRSSQDIADIKSTIQLFSLITPVSWEDVEHISKLRLINKECLEKVLHLTNENESNILNFSYGKNKYEIKPDILADYLRLEFMENKNFVRIMRCLIPYMAYRIFYNISVLKKFEYLFSWDEISENDNLKLKDFLRSYYDIDWAKIEKIEKFNLDDSIDIFIGKNRLSLKLTEKKTNMEFIINELKISKFNVKKVNGKLNIYKLYTQQIEIFDQILNELNTIKEYNIEYFRTLNLVGKVSESALYPGKYLDMIYQLAKNHPDVNINYDTVMRNQVAFFWSELIIMYGHLFQIDKMEICLNKIRELHKRYPDDDEVRKYIIANKAYIKYWTRIKNLLREQRFLFDRIFEGIKKRHLFIWDEIPGKDSIKLIDFLRDNYNIECLKIDKIEKINDGKIIEVSDGRTFILLNLNNEKTKVNLTINKIIIDEFISQTINDKLIISQKYFKLPVIKFYADDSEMVQNKHSLLQLKIANIGGIEMKDVNIEIYSEIDRKSPKKVTSYDYPQLKEINPVKYKELIFDFYPTIAGKAFLTILSSFKSKDGKSFQNKDEFYVNIHPEDSKNCNIQVANFDLYREQAIAQFNINKGKITSDERKLLDVFRNNFGLTKDQQKKIDDEIFAEYSDS
ncbi:MAG: Archaeal ATPase [Candidatus Methanoperedens nitroreducens]|uniref:Archaeal ATPase n=1 Tax=Candidatus Methanoperedens nitratireducens TaxID=1392998 RepID=A0A0P8E0V9_9EURY|nr:MAG: Archaeal ATPase [Candidatus Methanoperedens sp. BLZ1]